MNKAKTKSSNSPKTSDQTPKLDLVLWLLVVLILTAGVAGTYYFRALATPLKFSIWIGLLLIGGGLILKTTKGHAILDFAKKSRVELRKVVWPTRQETMQATGVVVLIVFVMSLMLWVIDSSLVWLASLATGQRG